MILGVCKIKLRLHGPHSLKEKRRVVKSIIAKVRNNYNVAVAEVDEQDKWQLATLGVSCISTNTQKTTQMLAKVVNFVSSSRFDIEMLDYETEIIPF